MKRLIMTAVAASVATSFSGNADAQKRELVAATSQSDAGKLDPHQASAGADKGVLNWVFNGLVRIRPGQSSPEFVEPDLAEKWAAFLRFHTVSRHLKIPCRPAKYLGLTSQSLLRRLKQ